MEITLNKIALDLNTINEVIRLLEHQKKDAEQKMKRAETSAHPEHELNYSYYEADKTHKECQALINALYQEIGKTALNEAILPF